MKPTFKTLILGLLLASFALQSCKKDEVQATESIEGTWDIIEINSGYGEYVGSSWVITEDVRDAGDLGTFDFGPDNASFTFVRNDTLYTGSGEWDLAATKENSGFFRVRRYTLTIKDHFVFRVDFGDRTKNSEKDATEAVFSNMVEEGGGVEIQMTLRKQ